MNCEQIYEYLSAMLDGELSAEDEARVRAHLDACPDCRRLYEAMASIEEKTAELGVPAPEGLKRGVMVRIRQESGKQKKKRGYWGVGTGFGLIAAVLVLMIGTGVIRLPRPQTAAKASLAATSATYAYMPAEEQEVSPDTVAAEWLASDELTGSGGKYGTSGSSDASAVESPADTLAPGCVLPNGIKEGSGEPQPVLRWSAKPVDETVRLLCADLSARAEAPILLYTEFSADSMLELLAEAEPELYDRLAQAEPSTPAAVLGDEDSEPDGSGLTVYAADCETVLAVQEWMLQNLPRSGELDEDDLAAEHELLLRMEALDPDGEALNRIVTWAPRTAEIDWPETWPEDWAVRLRTGENWALFYPEEDFVPEAGDLAFLVFAAPETETR